MAKPPIEVFPDMDRQDKYLAQAESPLSMNGQSDRLPITGTVARGNEIEVKSVFESEYNDSRFETPELHSGKDAKGDWIRGFPLEVNEALMGKGREHFDIYCAVCHGATGEGNGIVSKYGMLPANYHSDRIRDMAEGEIYNTITNGKGLMMGMAARVKVEERWAIILYMRALQKMKNANLSDVPQNELGRLTK